MRKLAIGAAMVAVLVVAAAVAAPHVRAQGRQPDRPPDLLLLPGGGSSIGASVRDLTADEAQKLKAPEGAYIDDVREGTPAAKAGLKSGDVVVEFDGEKIRSARQLTRVVRETPPDRSVKMTVVRDGSRRTMDVTPDSRSARLEIPDVSREVERAMRNVPRNFSFDFDFDNLPGVAGRARLGATLMSINDQLSTYFGVKNGVLVSQVSDDSPASRAGLKAGDVITAVNGRMVNRPNDVSDAIRDLDADGGTLDLKVTRDRRETSIQVPIPARERPRARAGRIPV
jgi:serine protease Do